MNLQLLVLLMAAVYGDALDCYTCENCPAVDTNNIDNKVTCIDNEACMKLVVVLPNQTLTRRHCRPWEPLQHSLLKLLDQAPATEVRYYLCYRDFCNRAARDQLSFLILLFVTVICVMINSR